MRRTRSLAARFLGGLVMMFLAAGALVASSGSVASAAFPGRNGLIAFQSDRDGHGELYVMNADGSAPTRLTDNLQGNGSPSWSPDGTKIAFTSGRDGNAEIYVMDANGANQTRLTNTGSVSESFPVWSPDGSKIAFISPTAGAYDVWVMDATGANPVNLTNNPAEDSLPAWSPDGSKIAFQSFRDGNFEIYVMGADGSNPTNLTNNAAPDSEPDWSPDGAHLVFARGTPEGGLFTMNPDGTVQAPVPGTEGSDHTPSWSPDGTALVFSNYLRNLNDEIYRMRLDGVGGATRLTNNAPPGGGIQPSDNLPDWQRKPGPADPTGEFTPLTPARIVDTRIGTGGKLGKLGPGAQFDVQINGQGGVPATGVSAVVLNATATEPSAASYLTVWPSGVPRPSPSNLNYVPGQTVPNLVTVAVGNGKVSVYNNAGATHVVFDVVGYYSSASGLLGSRFHAVTPSRIFDTRYGIGGVGTTPMPAGVTGPFKVTGKAGVPETGVTAVVMNVTVTQPTSSGFITVYPDDVSRPVASNLNFVPGLTAPNLVVVRVPASGIIDFYHFSNFGGTTHLLADVVGYFDDDTSTEAGRLITGLPVRLIDTRVSSPAPPPGCIPGGATLSLTFASTDVGAVVLNTTVTQPTVSGHVIVFPLPPPPPLASNLNFVPGQTVPNLVMVKLGTGNSIGFYNSAGCTHLVIDAFGAFTSASAPPPAAVAASESSEPYGDVTVGVG